MRPYLDIARSVVFWTVFFFGVLAIALSVPFVKLFAPEHEKTVQKMMRLGLRIAFGLSRIKVKVEGAANIPAEKGFIIAANHSSFLDSPALIAYFPVLFKIVADRSGFRLPLMRRLYTGAGYIRTDIIMNMKDIIIMGYALKRKDNVLIYSLPAKQGELGDFTQALAALSKANEVPVLPVSLKGFSKVLPMDHFLLRDGELEVRIGSPVHPTDAYSLNQAVKDLYDLN